MTKLGELYSNFIRIDLDTRGGYARVAEVKTNGQKRLPEFCAFKLMRHENDYARGIERFEDELKLLVEISADTSAPSAITKIYDSGFAPLELSEGLQKRETPNLELEVISTGTVVKDFLQQKSELQKKQPNYWLPYLVVELAPYDDSLLRQIHNQPKDDPSGLFRLPTGEVIAMALQLLDVMQYLHTKHRRAYMDWKPEHIYWNGLDQQVKLIDWNVTTALNDGPGEKQNIVDDLRIFCGAALYIGLTFVDPDDPTKPIGPRPTQELASPVAEIRRRYWTDNPDFYQRNPMLDDNIKRIIRRGLDPKHSFDSIEKLRTNLIEYAEDELGLTTAELTLQSEPSSPYFKALTEVHQAQQQLLQAQQHLMKAVSENGSKLEFTRLFDAIKQALKNFPIF
jgi:serine/threonine protein kinase